MWFDAASDAYIGATVFEFNACNGGKLLDIIAVRAEPGTHATPRVMPHLIGMARNYGCFAVRMAASRRTERLWPGWKHCESTYLHRLDTDQADQVNKDVSNVRQ